MCATYFWLTYSLRFYVFKSIMTNHAFKPESVTTNVKKKMDNPFFTLIFIFVDDKDLFYSHKYFRII